MARLRFRLQSPAIVLTVLALALGTGAERTTAANKRQFQVSARKYAYRVDNSDVAVIHVQQGDIVHITFVAEDIPHSFTIDQPYRISKRAQPGKAVTFEFLADRASPPEGFPIHCTLAIDDRCKEMVARLIVDPAP